MLLQIAFICVIAGMQGHGADAIECYTCTNTSRLPDCTTITKCPVDSACSSKSTTIQGTRYYTLGCRDIVSCPLVSTVSSNSGPSIVGRSLGATNCSECCHSNNCNLQLCQDSDPTCTDDKDYSCTNLGSVINICADSSHIKPYCTRFCGLCNTVDGGWSHWAEWSICDVTCGNGTRTKVRACSDPPPANGGSDCVGKKQTHEPCSKDLCPVHGGWSVWSPWGSCSATCDIGLQRRDRSCSRPYPARYGDHCYGDSRADRLCFPGACANGSWSAWGSWGSCHKTCGGGVKTRARNCDNPVPSLTGKYCSGYAIHSEPCNASPCQGPVVFFAKDLSTQSPGTHAELRFTNVTTNIGHGYSSSTGYFTAPVGGAYTFNVQICAYYNREFGIELYVNDGRISSMLLYGDADHGCRTMSVPEVLKTGDKVHVKTGADTTSGWSVAQDSSRMNSFSGALLH